MLYALWFINTQDKLRKISDKASLLWIQYRELAVYLRAYDMYLKFVHTCVYVLKRSTKEANYF